TTSAIFAGNWGSLLSHQDLRVEDRCCARAGRARHTEHPHRPMPWPATRSKPLSTHIKNRKFECSNDCLPLDFDFHTRFRVPRKYPRNVRIICGQYGEPHRTIE